MSIKIETKQYQIYLPDGDSKSFMFYHDLASLFGEKGQSDSVKKLRNKIKEERILPIPKIYFEVSTGIRTSNAEVFFKILRIIDELSQSSFKLNFSDNDWEELHQKLLSWKAPKKQKWAVGDIFSIKLQDDTFGFGQVLSLTPTIALLDLRKKNENIPSIDFTNTNVLSIIHTTTNLLNNHTWKVVANYNLLVDPDSGDDGKYSFRVGLISYSPNVLESIANYYWLGINNWVNKADLDKMIIKQ